jgi:RNA polymerase sigma-70 factor (ECF subfamily)
MTHDLVRSPWSISTAWSVDVVTPDSAQPRTADDLTTFDDRALAELAARGRRDAFDLLVVRHQRAIYHVCYRFGGSHEEASDLAQEAFLRAWRGLRTFRGQSALSTWLYRIAVNVCLNRVAAKGPDTEPIDAAERLEDHHAERPGAGLVRRERAAAVRQAIRALPKKQRATLILRAYHELPHRQIAEVLGSSEGAVKANFFHALANLKRILGREP